MKNYETIAKTLFLIIASIVILVSLRFVFGNTDSKSTISSIPVSQYIETVAFTNDGVKVTCLYTFGVNTYDGDKLLAIKCLILDTVIETVNHFNADDLKKDYSQINETLSNTITREVNKKYPELTFIVYSNLMTLDYLIK